MNSKLVLPIISRNLIYCDVGARGGISDPWKSFFDRINLVCFEPDQKEYDRLMAIKRDKDIIYKYALSNEPRAVLLNLTKSRGCSSVFKPNRSFLNKFSNSERFEIEKLVSVEATSLDTLYEKGIFPNVDFIKIDVQGSELSVLNGGVNFLKRHILGAEVEVEFYPLYEGQPLFSDVDHFIRNSLGLQIQDLRKTYWKYPEGIRIGGTKGQLIFADALYFRPPHEIISWCSGFHKEEALNKIQMGCLMGIVYGYLDYSLCLLSQPRIHDFMGHDMVRNWISIISRYGRSFAYRGKGSSRLASVFNILYHIFQPDHEGWGSAGHCLGMRKKFGVFS